MDEDTDQPIKELIVFLASFALLLAFLMIFFVRLGQFGLLFACSAGLTSRFYSILSTFDSDLVLVLLLRCNEIFKITVSLLGVIGS